MSNFISLKRFARVYTLPLWKPYLAGILFLIVTTLLTLEIPQFIKSVVNSFVDESGIVLNTGLTLLALGLLQMVVRSLSRIFIFWPARKLEADMKDDMFSHLMRLPAEKFFKFSVGDLISRMSEDATYLRVFFGFGFLQLLNLIFLSVFNITKMATTHLTLTLLCLLPVLLMVLVTKYGLPLMGKYSNIQAAALSSLTTKITESFTSISAIQAYGVQEEFTDRCKKDNENVYNANLKLLYVRLVIFPLMAYFADISRIIVLFYGGYAVIQGTLTVGDILAFNIYIGLLSFPLTAFGMFLSFRQRALTGLRRLHELDEIKEDKALLEHSKPIFSSGSLVKTQNLSFSYSSDSFTLRNINLIVSPNQKIGIAGKIGAGKTTLANLIARVLQPDPGTIFFEGKDILSFDPSLYHQKVAYALQNPYLFSETVKGNLLVGLDEKNISQTDIDDACRRACIYEEIIGLPHKFETEIGEKGIRLSGGQKARLALARVFLRGHADLFILDDVLAAVDHYTEKNLIENIYDHFATVLIVSHRPSVLESCDKIFILDQGQIIADGKFEDLKKQFETLLRTT